jgi:hypothetical protein
VFEAVQKAAVKTLPASQPRLPHAFYLALVSPDIERFLKYLPDARMEYQGRGLNPVQLEAAVWGVPVPSDQQTKALIEEQRKLGGYVRTPQMERYEAQLACVQINGVVQLKTLMHAVTSTLDALNLEGAWARAKVGNIPAAVAADTYINAVRPVVTLQQISFLYDIAEIAWNMGHIAKDAKKHAEVTSSANPVLECALEAAVLNRCGVEGYQAIYNDVQKVLNPSFASRSGSVATVLSALNLPKRDAAISFLKTLIMTAELGCHPTQMLKRACKATAGICQPESIRTLLSLRHTLLSVPRPMQHEIVEYPEYRAQTILTDLLSDYHKIFAGNPILKTAGTPAALPLSDGSVLTADVIKAKNLLVTSRLLAGIPIQELGRLLRSWEDIS